MRAVPVLLLLLAAALPWTLAAADNPCPDEPHHAYHAYASNGNARQLAGWGVAVADTNTVACNVGGDDPLFDGDYDAGVNGAFFGYGAWVDDPDCDYELNRHWSGVVTVNDLVWSGSAGYRIGEDDQDGPVKLQNPVTGEWTCTTDGAITPGDPSTDPTADADDCLMEGVGSMHTCGTGGGDGGFWVILYPTPSTFPPATTGTITSF